jgi:Putative peptidoglycan binding domain/LysM domain
MSDETVGQGDYVVQAGDTMASIADEHGFFWQTLWNADSNASLKTARGNPEILLPGDLVTIPEREIKSVAAMTGQRYVFRRRGVPSRIAFRAALSDGTILATKPYTLSVGDHLYEGTTGSDGGLVHWVSALEPRGTLRIWPGDPKLPEVLTWTLAIGHLEPLTTLNGVRSRLRNLGYACGTEQGEMSLMTLAALRRFQTDRGIETTGEADSATRTALREAFGS